MTKKRTSKKISYERDADVLRVELLQSPIDYATEMGPFIVHFNKKGMPVYVEVLQASHFLKESQRAFVRESVRATASS